MYRFPPAPAGFCSAARVGIAGVLCCPCHRCPCCLVQDAEAKVYEGSPAKTPGSPQILWRTKPGGSRVCFVQISSRLHCHGRARHALLWPKMSLGFLEPRPESCHLASGLCPECVGSTGTSPTSGSHPAAATSALIFANSKLLIGSSAPSIVAHKWGKGLSRNQQALTGEFVQKREVGAPAGLGREGFPW